MSIAAFIPALWEARLMAHLRKTHVFAARTRNDWFGEIEDVGDTVTIGQVGRPSISDYADTDDIEPEEVQTAGLKLTVDQAKKFSFFVKDVDLAQAMIDPMDEVMAETAYGLNDVIDQYIAGFYSQAGVTHGTDAAPIQINSANVHQFFAVLGQKLTEANVPEQGRWAIIPPWVHTKLVLAGILHRSDNTDALDNGRVGRALGFDFAVSNNVAVVSGTKYKILAGNDQAIAFAEKSVKIEAFRPEKKFREAIKGLHIYGGRVVQADCLACGTVTEAAES